MRRAAVAVSLVALAAGMGPALAHNEGLPSLPVDQKNMTHVSNVPSASGNNMAFFERKLADGTLARYAVVATQGNGFDIVEVTDPTHPRTVGRYLLPEVAAEQAKLQKSPAGLNWHAWVDVNPRRNIAALSIENPQGIAVRHNLSTGIQLVDITDVANPVPLGKVDGVEGPHTIRMIGDNHIYTSLPTYICEYFNPMAPTCTRRGDIEGHEYYEDPNIPGIAWWGTLQSGFGILDVTNPGNPKIIKRINTETAIGIPHEVYPAPDSSYVGVADFTTGAQTQFNCPGGGIHFYDVSGKYVPGASMTNPKRMLQPNRAAYFAPFTGLPTSPPAPSYGSCTMHSWQMQLERQIALGGLYMGGTWVFDPSQATKPGGLYNEYAGGANGGPTTWGNTLGNFRDAADYVNATQWWPFDDENPAFGKLVFVNGWVRGLDVYNYTGPLPKKMSRLRVDAAAPGGAISGKLDRYAVLTHTGFANKPLAGMTLQVTSEAQTAEAVTGDDGSFSAGLDLAPGTHQVTVTWAGDDVFAETTETFTVTA